MNFRMDARGDSRCEGGNPEHYVEVEQGSFVFSGSTKALLQSVPDTFFAVEYHRGRLRFFSKEPVVAPPEFLGLIFPGCPFRIVGPMDDTKGS